MAPEEQEREACAKVCDDYAAQARAKGPVYDTARCIATELAGMIRSRAALDSVGDSHLPGEASFDAIRTALDDCIVTEREGAGGGCSSEVPPTAPTCRSCGSQAISDEQVGHLDAYVERAAQKLVEKRTNEATSGCRLCGRNMHTSELSTGWICYNFAACEWASKTSAPRTDKAMVEGRWRVGAKLGRTIYLDNKCVGIVDNTYLACELVAAANGRVDGKK